MKELIIKDSNYREYKILVDDEDYQRVSNYGWWIKGGRHKSGYIIYTEINKKSINIANFVMKDYENMYDHIDRNPQNNQKNNLRVCTFTQNQWNKGPRVGHKYKGVSWYERDSKWEARITVNGKTHRLGRYWTEIEAAKVYDIAATRHYGEFAYLNFPNEIPVNKVQGSSSIDVNIQIQSQVEGKDN